jgi:hypothetical protein
MAAARLVRSVLKKPGKVVFSILDTLSHMKFLLLAILFLIVLTIVSFFGAVVAAKANSTSLLLINYRHPIRSICD